MYVDRPRPHGRTVLLPVLATIFFAVVGAVIGALAVLVLPPTLWMFTAPVIALCLAAIVALGRHVSGLSRLEYRIAAGVLQVHRRADRWMIALDDIVAVVAVDAGTVTPEPPIRGAPWDHGGVSSARSFANRPHGNVLLNVRGEWIRLSPTDPATFLRALEGHRNG